MARLAAAGRLSALDVEYGDSKRWMAALVPLMEAKAVLGAGLACGVAAGGVLMGTKMMAIGVGVVVVGAAVVVVVAHVYEQPDAWRSSAYTLKSYEPK